jgi:hypothetical protein
MSVVCNEPGSSADTGSTKATTKSRQIARENRVNRDIPHRSTFEAPFRCARAVPSSSCRGAAERSDGVMSFIALQ